MIRVRKWAFYFSVLFISLSPLWMHASSNPVEILYGNILPQHPIYHSNRQLAWNGKRQGDSYATGHEFYHANGRLAWDGMNRTRNSWGDPSKYGIFYYDNGKEVWGGIEQKVDSWGNHHKLGIFYHRNGEILWCGVKQKLDSWENTRTDGKFYYPNRVKVWGGLKQFVSKWNGDTHADANVYYDNEQLAWSGLQGSPVYDSSGNLIACADYVWIHLGYDSWLYIDYLGNYHLSLYLGEGYKLSVSEKENVLELYDVSLAL